MRQTLSIKNRNPWSVKGPMNTNRWRGQTDTDGSGHAIFESEAWSCRAAIKILRAYQRVGRQTLEEVFDAYAPADDPNANNEPNKYARFVSGRMDFPVNQFLGIFDGYEIAREDRLRTMLKAMAEYENFAGYDVGDNVIDEGIKLYNEVKT